MTEALIIFLSDVKDLFAKLVPVLQFACSNAKKNDHPKKTLIAIKTSINNLCALPVNLLTLTIFKRNY